jgi:hypothetical protein
MSGAIVLMIAIETKEGNASCSNAEIMMGEIVW